MITQLIQRPHLLFSLLATILFLYSCTNDDSTSIEPDSLIENPIVEEEEPIDETPEEEEEEEEEGSDFTPEGQIELFNEDKLDDSLVLVNDASGNRVYLMDKEARLVYEWELTNNIGNDVVLLPNGNLLASLEVDDPKIRLGGKGGRIQFIEPDGTLEWDFIYSSVEAETHHDVELLPNGNVIAMVWGRRPSMDAIQAGFMLDNDLFVESIIEINPNTSEIVWEWHSWDHLIQDFDATRDNFGVVAEHPELVDINYIPKSGTSGDIKGDIMHASGIAYDEVNDVILLNVNFYSEVWAIDHSTTTEEAASSSGGNYGKGGDLIYRFGNPTTYENPIGNRIFYNNHHPNLLKGEDEGKLLIFSNGNNVEQSTVFIFELPEVYELNQNTNNELRVSWSFTDPNLYSRIVSGAVVQPNGNLLVTEGDFGYWEITREKEIVWKFTSQALYWRGYSYSRDAPEIKLLGL